MTPRTAGLRSRAHSNVRDSISSLPIPEKEYESLNAKDSPPSMSIASNTSLSNLSNSSIDLNMDVEEGRGEISFMDEEEHGMVIEKAKKEENSSHASLIELPEFPIDNFYYFIKMLRACAEKKLFNFDDDGFMKLLQFCYSSIISTKHLGEGYHFLYHEIRELIAAIWKIVSFSFSYISFSFFFGFFLIRCRHGATTELYKLRLCASA